MQKAEINRLLDREAATSAEFLEFRQLLDATLHYESQQRLRELKASYEPFDPDAHRDPSTKPPTDATSERLFEEFAELLKLCNYRRLDREEIEEATKSASDWGVNLRIDFEMFRRIDVFVNEVRVDKYTRRDKWLFWRTREIEMPVYVRLAVIFQLADGASAGLHVQPNQIYLKLFKNIPKQDVDMLLPGARVQMSLLDQGKIFLPTITGLGMTGFKLFKGAVVAAAFAGFYGMLGFATLLAGTIGYGVKSFFGYQRTKEKYHFHLTQNLYYQNLANGRSVLFHLLDEAQEQEYEEAVLAYYVLWQLGSDGVSEDGLDREVEGFLREKANWDTDFEVDDALSKLRRLSLAYEHAGRWRAVDCREAIARLDQAWDNLFSAGVPKVAVRESA